MCEKTKNIIVIILAFCISFLPVFAVDTFAANENYSIVTEGDNLEAASAVLSKYLKQIISEKQSKDDKTKFILCYTEEVADNGYIIETTANSVVIGGNGIRGVIHGVYGFLEKYCGCKWYTKDVISVPENASISFPAGEKTKYEPFFEYTDTDWYSGDLEYSVANGLTGGVYRDIPKEYGGDVSYIGSFAHTLSTVFCSSDKYFAEHPEYFALHEGERTPDQLCLTNENTYKIVRDEVLDVLKQQHKPEEYLQIISLTQNDNEHMCQCDNCKALDDANGSHAGTMITFVNKIAKDVKAAGYNNVAIDTFAYQYTRKAPTQVKPDDNVIVRLCTIECCFAHTLDDENCEENIALMQDLKNWGEICNRIYVWDYTTNYNHTLGIFPDFGVIQRNMQIFYENNVKGIYEEGNYYISSCDGEFGDLRCYLLSKLMQNPYIDFNAEMSLFNNAFYGDAGKYITDFIKMTIEKPCRVDGHLGIYFDMTETLGFNKNDISKADELWENAKTAVKEDSELYARVERSETCWRYWKLFNTADMFNANDYANELKNLGIVKIQEGGEKAGGPEAIPDLVVKTCVLKYVTPAYIVLYAIALVLCLLCAIFAMKTSKKNWIYIVSFIILGGYYEIFGWNIRSYLSWKNPLEWQITVGLVVALFVFFGALAARGKKKRLISALICGVLSFVLYEIGTFGINTFYYKGNAENLGITVSFLLLSLLGVILLSVNFKNVIKEYKTRDNK